MGESIRGKVRTPKRSLRSVCLLGAGLLALSACASFRLSVPSSPLSGLDQSEPVDTDPAGAVHEALLVMDTHLDTPANFSDPDFSLVGAQSVGEGGTQVDLPRMMAGGLDGGFWVIYTAQGPLTTTGFQDARDHALIRAGEIREAVARHNEHFELAFTADDAARIAASGKRIVYQSIENAYPLGLDMSVLETFYRFGVRMVGPVHFANNQLADSSTDPAGQIHNGLSELGDELVDEANRLGMILDGSHAHDETVYDMLARSKTPIILSHTGVKAIYDHPRNIDDDLLKALAEAGGVIQINAFSGYLEEIIESSERLAALAELEAEYGEDQSAFSAAKLEAYTEARSQIDKRFPRNISSFEVFAEHLLHALDVVGPDYVGIGADWDGGGGVGGMEDIASLPRITALLLERGYSVTDIEKIWSGNMLRILKAAEMGATADIVSLPSPR
ncbi:MAG: dipeptidase [Hyphomonadaceae bacterium]